MSEGEVETARPTTAGRTIAFASLSDAQRAELVKALGSGAGSVVARGRDRFVARERLALGLLPFSFVGLIALALGAFADACWPTQTWIWAVAYATAAMPIAYVVTRAVGARIAAQRMPFAPGVYVTSDDVILAHASAAAAMRVVPISAIAAVGTPRRLPLSPYAEVTIWLENEPAETLSILALQADEAVGAIERVREPVPQPTGSARDARRRDPLGELKRTTVWERAAQAAPASDVPRSVVVSALVALALGVIVLVGRNAISDRVALQAAISSDDVEALRCYVEHDGVHAAHVAANALPHAAYGRAVASGDLTLLGDYVTAYPEGPDTAQARAAWIEGEYAIARDDAWRLRAFLSRFPDAPQAGDARERLPRLALASAIEADDVGSYAFVMREHPGTPEATEAARRRSERYTRVLDEIVLRGGRPEAITFFRALFAYLEAHETHDVLVRFRTPSSEVLRDFDRIASELAERPVEPISPSFSRRLSEQREALVFDRLREAFIGIAPRDVLPVVRGTQLPSQLTPEQRAVYLAPHLEDREALAAATAALDHDQDDDSGEPEIRILYDVLPDGRIFTSSPDPAIPATMGDPALAAALARMGIHRPDLAPAVQEDRRAFVGFRIRFDIEMRTPTPPTTDAATPATPGPRATFSIDVAPPPSVHIEAGDDLASAGAIYEAMATEAFDQLGAELLRGFFGEVHATDGPPSDE